MGKQKAAGRKPDGTATCHYVASTHWDREWYEPFQHYRFRLVDLLDGVVDLLENDPQYPSFLLDGQTCVLEDYLAIRPERRARIAALVRAGRLSVGPWYVMPDEFLPAGESLVRNLQRGLRVAGEFGRALRCGYVCDIFGHNSQLPQILRHFGIDTAVVWRGTNYPKHPGLFNWQAADGSTVLAYTFEDRGYGHYHFDVRQVVRSADGALDFDKAVHGLRNLVRLEQHRVPGDVVLICDSMDHVPPEPATGEVLARARAAGVNIVHTSLEAFFDAVRKQGLRFKTVRGELRDPCERAGNHLIQGVGSSRIHLKQYNAHCETLLTRWVEPFAAFAALLGAEHPTAFLDLAWRYLLLNHPHDSICGCSIDQVHHDMAYRYDQCRLIAERAGQMSLREIADRTPLPDLDGDEDFAITVFNGSDAPLDGVVDLPLYFKRDTPHRFQEWFGYEPIIGFRLYDADGGEQPYQRLDVEKAAPLKTYDRLLGYYGDKRERVRIATKLQVPPNGWTTLVCRPTSQPTRSTGTQLIDDHAMQNDRLRVRINGNGTLDVTERDSGRTYRDLLTLEERADIGDGWFHGTAVNDEVFSSMAAAADVALVHDGFALTTFKIRVVLNVPACFERDKQVMRRSAQLVPLVVNHWVTLRAGAPVVEVCTEVDNTVRDHRLRVLFPSDLDVDTYFADSPFDVVERDIALRPDAHRLAEPEVETRPQYTFTAVNDGRRGLAVLATGQPESAVRDLPRRPIALTLLRGFYRTVATEGEAGGQQLGRTRHRYWLYPHQGALPASDLCQLGTRLAAGVQCIYTEPRRRRRLKDRPTLPATGSFVRPAAGSLVQTACTRSADGKAVVLRLFNPTDERVREQLQFALPVRSAHDVDFHERPTARLAARGDTVTVEAAPRRIITLRIVLEKARKRR